MPNYQRGLQITREYADPSHEDYLDPYLISLFLIKIDCRIFHLLLQTRGRSVEAELCLPGCADSV